VRGALVEEKEEGGHVPGGAKAWASQVEKKKQEEGKSPKGEGER